MNRPFADVRVIFFDVDDTLYDFNASVRRTLFHLRERFPGVLGRYRDGDLERAYQRANDSLAEDLKLALIERDPFLYRRATWEAFLEGQGGFSAHEATGVASRIADEFGRHRFENLRASAYDGAEDAVRSLATRYRVGAITNGPSALQRGKIEALGYDRVFEPDLVTVSGEFGERKPHASIFESAARRAGVLVEECVMIGDSVECDLPCRALGMKSVLFRGAGKPWDADSCAWPPDAVVETYSELMRLFG